MKDIIDPFTNIKRIPITDIIKNDNRNLFPNSLQVGSGIKMLRVDPDGLWLGGKKFSSATFKVDMDGNLTASSISLSGGSSSITGVVITGGTLQTATSGQRIVISDNKMIAYNSVSAVLFELLNSSSEVVKYYASGSKRAQTLFELSGNSADVVYIETGQGTGKAINVYDTGTTRTDPLVNIQSNIDVALRVQSSASVGNASVKIVHLDLDKTGVVISDETAATAQNDALLQVECGTSNLLHSVLQLRSNTTKNIVHINFVGGVTPTSFLDGDFWFDGSDLKLRAGGVTYTISKS